MPGRASPAQGWGGLAYEAGTVFVAARPGKVLALDAGSGERRWVFEPQGDNSLRGVYAAPLAEAGVVFIGGYNGRLYALDAASGGEKWSRDLEAQIVGGLSLTQGRLLVASGNKVFALGAERGELLGAPLFEAEGAIWSSPVVDGSRVYVATMSHSVYALELATGARVWAAKVGGAVASPPAVVGELVIVGSFDRNLYALDRGTGAPRPLFQAGNWFWAKPLALDGWVYVGSLDKRVYALEAASGVRKWDFATQGPVMASPLSMGERVLVASGDGRVYALDRITGARRWDVSLGSKVLVDPVQGEGKVFVLADQEVIAIDPGTGSKLWSYDTRRK